jgi:uncharacterized protein DUF4168
MNLDWKMVASIVAFSGSLILGNVTTVFSQQSPKTQPGSQQATVNEKELRAFVKAYVETQRIRQQYEPALGKNKDAEKDRLIENKANDELKKNLAKQNLTVEQYNRIFNQVNSNEALRRKTLKLVEEERKSTQK